MKNKSSHESLFFFQNVFSVHNLNDNQNTIPTAAAAAAAAAAAVARVKLHPSKLLKRRLQQCNVL